MIARLPANVHDTLAHRALLLALAALLALGGGVVATGCEAETTEAEAAASGNGAEEAGESESDEQATAESTENAEVDPDRAESEANATDEVDPPTDGTTDAPAEAEAEAQPAGDDEELAPETLEALEALGYVDGTETSNPEVKGVSKTGSTDTGLNLYSSRYTPNAVLVDMDGEVVHRWTAKDADGSDVKPWMHIEPLEGGELLIIARDNFLSRRDWDSNLIWRTDLEAHHDVALHPDGKDVYLLSRERREFEYRDQQLPILADEIVVLDFETGEVKQTVQLVPLFEDLIRSSRGRLNRIRQEVEEGKSKREIARPGGWADVLHTNTIEFLHSDIEGVAPAGSIILSSRAQSTIAIIDADMDEILWTWGTDVLDGQHDPTQLDNGNILLFDNGLARDKDSRVIEVDPKSGEIVWTTEEFLPELFSEIRSGAQQLPNGNVLICESDRGHAIEVTREGEVVWEYWSPEVEEKGEKTTRGVFYRFNRFPRSMFPLENGE